MILNTGNRTDIPAFFSDWFFNRIQEGFVCVRNPYFPHQVTKYILDPQVIDIICFCTKNPKPMLSRLDLIKDYKRLNPMFPIKMKLFVASLNYLKK